MERIVLTANDGMVLTNGEIYGKEIYLGAGTDPNSYHEITEAEYEAIKAQKEKEWLERYGELE